MSSDVDKFVEPSIEIELSSKNIINLFNFKWPARLHASWLRPSIKQPSPANTYVKWSITLLLNFADNFFSAIANPTAFDNPWDSGPVVVSIPGKVPNSGCPAVGWLSYLKFFIFSIVIPLYPSKYKHE